MALAARMSIAQPRLFGEFLARNGKFGGRSGDTVLARRDYLHEEATMYHPDMMLNIAHQREAELVREAVMCGVPKAEHGRQKLSGPVVAMALCGAIGLVL